MRKLLQIEGMSCGHCVMHVKSALEGVAGVAKAEVDLVKKSAMVEGEGFDLPALSAAVAEAGYKVVSSLP
ncbi:MAG TPA: heavy-metal-associated domain-containing protein [Spirochaetales bacterium]|nr:heavy-metal-associated domain-containing protein [Spirochaetales bacterium]